MLLYKTFITRTNPNENGGNPVESVSWQGSQTESSKARSAAKKDGCKAESRTVEVPTAKGPLLAWLNENVKA